MAWSKVNIMTDAGREVEAQAPVIISASRSTDIPAFYADWFFHRLKVGYSAWTNPFNGKQSYISYAKTRFIVFWSKNPKPLIPFLPQLAEKHIGCYIQYTLNDYESEASEKGVPPLAERIATFKQLVTSLGKGSVVWRFDPLLLTDKITIDHLLEKIENIGNQLMGYTDKLVFSFADIASYRKVKANLERSGVHYQEWSDEQMIQFAQRLSILNTRWNYELATCGEKIDLSHWGIKHNHCVDDDLMIRLSYHDKALMQFLGVELKPLSGDLFSPAVLPPGAIGLTKELYAIKTKNNKDKGQRALCGCMVSKDIGEYNTCPHLCEYCYANASKELAVRNWKQHQKNKKSETITNSEHVYEQKFSHFS